MGINKQMEYNVISLETKEISNSEKISLNINKEDANYIVHRALQQQNKLNRQFTASTKTRSEIRGGGRKPWKQKGTGNARAGSNRSPLWKGGGVIFGPKPKVINKKLNRKEFQLALRTLIYNQRSKLEVFNKIDIENTKTKELSTKLFSTKNQQKTLVILAKPNKNVQLAMKNIPNVETILVSNLNIRALLGNEKIVTENEALQMIPKIYKK